MPNPCLAPEIEVRARLLSLGAENRIAATHVRHHGMRPAGLIPQFDACLFRKGRLDSVELLRESRLRGMRGQRFLNRLSRGAQIAGIPELLRLL